MNYDNVAKNIVDRLYNEIQCKMQHNLTLYFSYGNKHDANKAWIAGEVKRYKQLLAYIKFLRKNKAYYKVVSIILQDEITRANKPIHLDFESDTFGIQ